MKILCYGDSLTAGYCRHGLQFFPYSQYLQDLLKIIIMGDSTDDTSKVVVDHIGQSGYTTKDMIESCEEKSCYDLCGREWCGYHFKLTKDGPYDVVTILAGTNDIGSGAVTADQAVRNISVLAALALDSHAKTAVGIMTVPSCGSEYINKNIKAKRKTINEGILEIIQ